MLNPEFRNKGLEAIKHVFALKKSRITDNASRSLEQDIFDVSESILRVNEDLNNVYFANILQVMKHIQVDNYTVKSVTQIIKNGKLNWSHDSVKDMVSEEFEQDDFIIKPFEVEEGVVVCKCGSKRVYSYCKQTRGGDESTTTFATCLKCKSQWTYSG